MDDPGILLKDFLPRSGVVTGRTEVLRPRFGVIDAHNHLGELLPGLSFSGSWGRRAVSELMTVMDTAGVRVMVDLDGQTGDRLKREVERYSGAYPEKFLVFAGMDYEAIGRGGDFGRELARQLREHVGAGARGLKVWKPLGLQVRDAGGELVKVADRRLDELWATAGELGVPVMIHVGDPVAFFEKVDGGNERIEELGGHPEWRFPSPPFPGFMELVEGLAEVVERHPGTNFVGAHVGCYAENLGWVGALLDRCANFFVDISARLGELGRAPYSARAFFLKHSDRILFGTDMPAKVEVYRLHYRFLETWDEYFPYYLGERPPQGRWMIYGLGLPDEVLERVYYLNAERVLGIKK